VAYLMSAGQVDLPANFEDPTAAAPKAGP
jgi:hypothetical protein